MAGVVHRKGIGMKRALLFGTNKYPCLNNCDLNGCLNDIDGFIGVFNSVYSYDQIMSLKSEEATRENILEALEWAVSGLESKDTLTICMSGHGTQIPDTFGDEYDGLTEAFCAYDTVYDGTKGLVTDDEFKQRLEKINELTDVCVICDACHSESMTRDIIKQSGTSRFIELDIYPPIVRGGAVKKLGGLKNNQTWISISGCRDSGTSADAWFDGKAHGALSWSILKSIAENPNMSYVGMHTRACEILKENNFSQVSIIHGRSDKLMYTSFGGTA